MSKIRIYLLGIATLLMAPLAWILQGLPDWQVFLKLNEIANSWSLLGIQFGFIAGFMMLVLTNNQEATDNFHQQIRLIKSLRLNLLDTLFLSFCAGFGEELLFRVALQEWLHPILASIVFVAIHGYISLKDWSTTKYGLLVLLFIVALSYAIKVQGLWFCIFAHATYDFVIFYFWSRYKSIT